MINFGSTTGGKPTYNQRLFYLDFDSDVSSLATDRAAIDSAVGSTAYVIQSSSWYKKNSNGEWIKQSGSAGGNTPGEDPGEGGEVPWDPMDPNEPWDPGEIPWEPMEPEPE